jgi:hypothetical protein
MQLRNHADCRGGDPDMSGLLAQEELKFLRQIAEQNRQDRELPRQFARALLAGDAKALVATLAQLDCCFHGWRNAFRRCAKLESIPADMKPAMLELWRHSGDHLRNEIQDDMVLGKALRVLLPAYTGPHLTLYRGDGAWNRRRRTYGLSWSASQAVAEAYADGPLWRSCQGGSVLLQADVPPEAIICAPALLADGYGEGEYLVDRRHLRSVAVLRRYTEQRP